MIDLDGSARFAEVWQRRVPSPPSPDAQTVFGELRRRYDEPFRQYHNLRHILDCLRLCDELGPADGPRCRRDRAVVPRRRLRQGSVDQRVAQRRIVPFGVGGRPFMFRHRLRPHPRHAALDDGARSGPPLSRRHRSLGFRRVVGRVHAQRRAAARGVLRPGRRQVSLRAGRVLKPDCRSASTSS